MSDRIVIRGARQHNLKNLSLDLPLRRADRRDRRLRLGQVVARLRHALRRGPAPLRRDVLAVRAAVPRPHGQAAGRPHRGHPAGDRDRPDESGAHVALDGRHDDRARRLPEAAVRARRDAVLPRLRPQGAPRHAADRSTTRWPSASAPRAIRALAITFPVAVPENFTEAEVLALLERQGYTRIHARRGRSSTSSPTGLRVGTAERARIVEALEAALRVGNGPRRDRASAGATRPIGRDERRSRSGASRPTCTAPTATSTTRTLARALLVQLAARRLRDVPRLRPRDRHRLRARDPRRRRRRCAAARSSRGRARASASARTTSSSTRRSAASRSTCRGATSPKRAPLGARRRARMGELEALVARHVVRRQALLRLARDQGVQDAHPRAAVEVPRLHAVRDLRRRAAQARGAAVAARHEADSDRVLDAAARFRPRGVTIDDGASRACRA